MSIELLEQKLHLLNYTKADLLAELEPSPNDYNLLIALGKTTRDISKLTREINSKTKNIIAS